MHVGAGPRGASNVNVILFDLPHAAYSPDFRLLYILGIQEPAHVPKQPSHHARNLSTILVDSLIFARTNRHAPRLTSLTSLPFKHATHVEDNRPSCTIALD